MVHVKGVDVFDPTTGEVRSDGADGIACWFIDTDYNEESFFVRHAYFLGQNDPYGALKSTLKAEIDVDVWATLNSEISRPFPMPKSGRIAVKVIDHLGDEVKKDCRVDYKEHRMKITPTTLTVSQLLSSQNEQYVIPAYQRRYSWHRPQIEDLWDDLQILEGADSHLFGTIVCLAGHHTAGVNRLELV